MRWLTYNVWHGLSGSGLVRFGELESRLRRERRYQLQSEGLKAINADLITAQELNPVRGRSKRLASDWGLREIHLVDNAGIKLLGCGWPTNLNSGLGTFFRPNYELKKVWRWPLSGSLAKWRWRDLYCVQLSETRWALAALLSDKGRMFVTVNTHLHHTFEMIPEYQTHFAGLSQDLLQSLQRGNERRELEIKTLIRHLEYQKLFAYPVLLSGDFNATPEASCFQRLKEKGFVDLWSLLHPKEPGYTWDRDKNVANHELLLQFDNYFEDSRLPAEAARRIREYELLPRRLDYLWLFDPHKHFTTVRVDIAMTAPDASGLIASDHFAVVADIEWN